MERIPDIDDAHVADLKAAFLAIGDPDPDMSPEDTCLRAEIYPGTFLKFGDDITCCGVPEFTLRVVCAASGAGCAAVYYPPWFGDTIVELNLPSDDITDRAPLDPEETPMPIFPEETPP